MATIEESKIYEYYLKVFEDLETQDGGYFPSKHDSIALSKTATHFSISESEASRIFDEFSKKAADLEMEKVKKLPPAARKRFFQQRAHDIFCNNRDLPFYKYEGEPSDELVNPLDILTEQYQSLIETVAGSGWTIPLNIDIRRFDELKIHIGSDESINSFYKNYYSGRELRYIYRQAKKMLPAGAQQQTFEECFNAYNSNQFTICRTALVSVLEGMISEFNANPCDVRVMHVCDSKAKAERAAGNNIKSLCWLSMYEFTRVLYNKSDFSQDEPSCMNRHWIEHGRTNRIDDGVDCLKLFNAISTMAYIKSCDV